MNLPVLGDLHGHGLALARVAPGEPGGDAERRWRDLVDRYVPEQAEDDGAWRFSRAMRDDEPLQGWKLHVAGTILNAADVLAACAPYLVEHDVLFKCAADLKHLARLNAGIFYGFGQVGKFITVYPRNAEAALSLAAELDSRTRGFEGPRVPYDLPYRPGGCVYYRYGGFRSLEIVEPDGRRATAIVDPRGKLWTDRREPGHTYPEWIANPFEVYEAPVVPELRTAYLVYEALSQRGKGGVYSAIDIRTIPARKCVLKEGRRHGETTADGTDGYDLIGRERAALHSLLSRGVPVPEVLGGFEAPGHRYLALEHVDGTNLMAMCSHPRVKLPLDTADTLAARVARLVADIHATGWVWRDLKPLNLIVTDDGRYARLTSRALSGLTRQAASRGELRAMRLQNSIAGQSPDRTCPRIFMHSVSRSTSCIARSSQCGSSTTSLPCLKCHRWASPGKVSISERVRWSRR